MILALDVAKVTVVRREGRTDVVYLILTEEQAKKVHPEEGGYWAIFRNADFRIEVTRGRGEEAAKALGVPEAMIEILDIDAIQRGGL